MGVSDAVRRLLDRTGEIAIDGIAQTAQDDWRSTLVELQGQRLGEIPEDAEEAVDGYEEGGGSTLPAQPSVPLEASPAARLLMISEIEDASDGAPNRQTEQGKRLSVPGALASDGTVSSLGGPFFVTDADASGGANVSPEGPPPVAAAAPDEIRLPDRTRLIDELEYSARMSGAPDGTSVSPDNLSRWIAEFVVRRFEPKTHEDGEELVRGVSLAYDVGLRNLVSTYRFVVRERFAHSVVRIALESFSRDDLTWPGPLRSNDFGMRLYDRIDEILGTERVGWLYGIRPDAHFLSDDDEFLRHRIALYAVFKMNPATKEEAVARSEEIVAIGTGLVHYLSSLGMRNLHYARRLAKHALQRGMSLDADEVFDVTRAREVLREVVEGEVRYYDERGPEWRMAHWLQFGGESRAKVSAVYPDLLTVRDRMKSERSPGGSDPGASGGAGPAPAGGGDAGSMAASGTAIGGIVEMSAEASPSDVPLAAGAGADVAMHAGVVQYLAPTLPSSMPVIAVGMGLAAPIGR